MQAVATTRMSSRGQVVIPEGVRGRLGLEAGVQFVVVGEGDVVILKTLAVPSMDGIREIIRRARKQARAIAAGRARARVARARSRKGK